jgi:Cd2+/Zn2+-exporting ATPase
LRIYLPLVISFILLTTGILLDYVISTTFFAGIIRLIWYLIAFLPVGVPVMIEMVASFRQKDFFTEFSLMGIASLGAFFIGEYPEGVAVMLFYAVGERLQETAVNRVQGNIKALLDLRSETACVLKDGSAVVVDPQTVLVGDTIQVKAGEKVPLDGILLSSDSSFDTSALTGESKPKIFRQHETVLAGMINTGKIINIQVTKVYSDCSFTKILEMVQDAASRKAKTELLIRKFAKIYTPAVFGLALLIALLPWLLLPDMLFSECLYRALVFLVMSCPCALVISVPLSYFGGIGAASRNGILFKGANYIDMIAKVNTVVMDKTGTLTKGVFKIREIVPVKHDTTSFMHIVKAIEAHSNHPIAKAIAEYNPDASSDNIDVQDAEEMAGYGLKGTVNGQSVLAGNTRLMRKFGIDYDKNIDTIVDTLVVIAINNVYAGYITIADELKEDALFLADKLRKLGIQKTVLLSGDKDLITQNVAQLLGIDTAYGDLLPEDKVHYMEACKQNASDIIAFMGDGINDAPVLALSDIGIAMGGMGSDAAVEVADVVIQTDQPSKLITAFKIAKATQKIVWINISMALLVKFAVFILGALGIATLWEAVFADVGVSLLAILNAVRILRKKF